jgi:DNA helicase HerA-like ATPase
MSQILIGKGERPVHLLAKYGNRHGLIAGATGTGKTISLMVLAEGFSRLGVPVFMADVKGDVSGLSMAGISNQKIQDRVAQIGMEGYTNEACPVLFWDLYGKAGHPVRTTISEIGPNLLGRILEINETQEGMLEIAFKLADDQGLLLLDLDDLRALLGFLSDQRKEISAQYGLVSTQSVAAVQRALLSLEREGGKALFGEPALELNDLMRTDLSGRGIVNILIADQLVLKPRLYSSCSRTSPRWATSKNPNWCSSSMRPTCSLMMRRRCCANGWSRSCVSSAPRVSGFTSVRNFPTTCPMKSWVNSGTASSTLCGPLHRATRRR